MDQDFHRVVVRFFTQYFDLYSGVGPDLIQVLEKMGVGVSDSLYDAVITGLQLVQRNLGLNLDASLVVRNHIAVRIDFWEAKEFIQFVDQMRGMDVLQLLGYLVDFVPVEP